MHPEQVVVCRWVLLVGVVLCVKRPFFFGGGGFQTDVPPHQQQVDVGSRGDPSLQLLETWIVAQFILPNLLIVVHHHISMA